MSDIFNAIKISDHVYWVGAVDWTIRDFHGYTTKRGSTYNAYLILADKITLIDTVKAPFKHELLARIASITDPGNIQCVISNHSEMDHSGCLAEIINELKPDEVYASTMGVKALKEYFMLDGIVPVKTGDEINLGNMNLSFMETRMLHWPDSMFSYLEADKLLFSQDAFGMHLASTERFADEIDESIIDYEAATYYANILMPYSQQVLQLIENVSRSNLAIETIAPDHGPIWRENLQKIQNYYKEWANQKAGKKAVIVYDTMWHSTERMARAIEEGLIKGGIRTKSMSMQTSHRSEVVYELLDAGALIAGSPTLNNNILPTMADVLTYLKGLRPKNLIGATFGSYGWSGESPKHIAEILAAMNVDIVAEPLKTKYAPDREDLTRCYDLGYTIAKKLLEV